jgi:hypothetical protein
MANETEEETPEARRRGYERALDRMMLRPEGLRFYGPDGSPQSHEMIRARKVEMPAEPVENFLIGAAGEGKPSP